MESAAHSKSEAAQSTEPQQSTNPKHGHVPAKKRAKLAEAARCAAANPSGTPGPEAPKPTHGSGGCHFFLVTKSRFCPTKVKTGSLYCGHHSSVGAMKDGDAPIEQLARVPCPFDPTHAVHLHKLKKHLKICNKRPIERFEPFFSEDINAGEDSDDENELTQALEASSEVHVEGKVGYPLTSIGLDKPVIHEKHRQSSLLHQITPVELYNLSKRIEQLAEQYLPEIAEDISDSEECLSAFGALEGRNMKHISQISHMISIMKASSMCSEETVCLEFGAGKGILSHMVHTVFKCGTILIDRKGFRQKADRFERENDEFHRIKMDIKDLNLAGVEFISNKPVVAIGKHLCGPATDLTLRCFRTHPRSAVDGLVHGVCIALCCHHICDWKSYTNKSYIRETLGLTKDEFKVLCKMTSWAVCGTREKKPTTLDDANQQKSSTREDGQSEEAEGDEEVAEWQPNIAGDESPMMDYNTRCRVGYKAKRLLDWGRVLYLRGLGFDARLVRYCSAEHSPENILLFAQSPKAEPHQ